MSLTVTFDRSSLSLADLVIGTDPGADFWLPEDGVGRADVTQRRTYAPSSPWLHGQQLVSAVREQSSVPVSVYVQGGTAAALKANMLALEDAVSQFTYDFTVTENGVGMVWAADPADVSWSPIDAGMSGALLVRAGLTIPVYPIAS